MPGVQIQSTILGPPLLRVYVRKVQNKFNKAVSCINL
jgi:hypothetical protein